MAKGKKLNKLKPSTVPPLVYFSTRALLDAKNIPGEITLGSIDASSLEDGLVAIYEFKSFAKKVSHITLEDVA